MFLRIPFLRIMIPFVSGIVLAVNSDHLVISWRWLFVPLCLVAFIISLKSTRPHLKTSAIAMVDLFLLMYGMVLVDQHNESRHNLFYGKKVSLKEETSFTAFVNELPLEKERSIKINLRLLQVKQGSIFEPAEGNLIAYFRKSNAALRLKTGDALLVRAKLQEVQGPKNPGEFDYKAYLFNRQLYHTVFIDSVSFEILPRGSFINPLWQCGLYCKEHILGKLKQSSLDQVSYAICAALLTGYDDEIDKQVMDAFSHSGTLHVLSVSGLHTGLIYLVLGYLFDLVDRRKKYKVLRFVFITLVLWFFALITGFSSPVLRAVITFNLLGIGRIWFRNDAGNQMNILLVSAFALLCYNPYFITDVGFQLSYFAMAGLVIFQPKLSQVWQPDSIISKTIWQSLTASFAATIATLPLTLYYFKQFPAWFFVCNLVVVSGTFVLLLLAVLVVVSFKPAALLINYLVKFLVTFIDLFNSRRFGFVDMINFDLADALFLSGLIVLISLCFLHRSSLLVYASLVLMICWQAISLFMVFAVKNKECFTVYSVKNELLFSVKCKDKVVMNDTASSSIPFHVKPQLIGNGNTSFSEKAFNYIESRNCGIMILDKPGTWPEGKLEKVKIIVLSGSYQLREGDLRKLPVLKSIVLTGPNKDWVSKKTEELSRKFGIDFYDTGQQGAWLLQLD